MALLANLTLLALYLWGAAGQTTVVEVRNEGGAFTALTDGRRVVPGGDDKRESAPLDVPERGTIVLVVPPQLDVMPGPSGIDSIVVTGSLGETLFEDDFDTFDTDTWEVLSGGFAVKDGVLTGTSIDADNSLILRREGWSDYSVRVTYRNGISGVIGTNVTGDGSLFYHFDLTRDFPNYFSVHNRGEEQPGAAGGLMRTSRTGPLRSTAAMLSQGYPYLVAGMLIGVAVVLALSMLAPQGARLRWRPRLRLQKLDVLTAVVLAAGAFGATLFLNATFYTFLPHVPDEVAYLFQANLFSHFKVMGDMPPVHQAFYFYFPTSLYERGDQWASFYPFGHPLILALGEVLGAVNFVPSLVGSACVFLTFLIGRRLYDASTGLVAAGLLVLSPFFLMQASSYMSHNTATLYLLLALYLILRRDRPVLWGALAGLCFGLALNTRMLTAAAVVPVYGALILSYLVRGKEDLRTWLRHTGPFVVMGLVMVGAFLLYNQAITGDAFTSPYTGTQGASSELFGFRDGHYPDIGLRNVQSQLMALLIVFNAWPAWAALGLVLAPFLLGTRQVRDYFLAAAVLCPMVLYIGYRYSGIYEGPRYWYEEMPFLVLLSARGATIAADRLASAAAWLRERLRLRPQPAVWAGHLAVYAVVAVLVVSGTGSWLLGHPDRATMPLVPDEASKIEGLFGVDDRLDVLADEMDLKNALVLVRPCGVFQSAACYGSVFLRNLPNFNGEVVWARYDESLNAQTIAAYPGRTVYVATWDPKASIEPLTGD